MKAKAAPAWGRSTKHSAKAVTIHHANAVRANIPETILLAKSYHTVARKSKHSPSTKFTEIVDWLIDSGCSIGMTPNHDDLISDITKTSCVVEVTKGVLTRAPQKGAVKIRVQDIYTGDSCFVLMHNVL